MALLSERAAREGFPDEDPTGRKISGLVPDDNQTITVIVGNALVEPATGPPWTSGIVTTTGIILHPKE